MAAEIYTTYEQAFEKLQPNASTYLVIVTRGHKDDMRVLAWAVDTPARYIGMIGSKRKVLSVYKALEKEGHSPEKFERVHAPVGLDIGALTPEEIAVSIAAELIAVRRNAANLPHKAVKLADIASTAARLARHARRRDSRCRRIQPHGRSQSPRFSSGPHFRRASAQGDTLAARWPHSNRPRCSCGQKSARS